MSKEAVMQPEPECSTTESRPALSPEQRMNAVAEILARGLARALLSDLRADGGQIGRTDESSSFGRSCLIEPRSRALMDTASDEHAAHNGRIR